MPPQPRPAGEGRVDCEVTGLGLHVASQLPLRVRQPAELGVARTEHLIQQPGGSRRPEDFRRLHGNRPATGGGVGGVQHLVQQREGGAVVGLLVADRDRAVV
jgi:hypothetical protein